MIEDMTIRKFTPKTQHDYVQGIKNFAVFLGRSPDTASFEDVRRYQLHQFDFDGDDSRTL
jgi:integrase/recombinase XerD